MFRGSVQPKAAVWFAVKMRPRKGSTVWVNPFARGVAGLTKPSPMQHGIVSAHHHVVHVRQITINSKNQVSPVDCAGRWREGIVAPGRK